MAGLFPTHRILLWNQKLMLFCPAVAISPPASVNGCPVMVWGAEGLSKTGAGKLTVPPMEDTGASSEISIGAAPAMVCAPKTATSRPHVLFAFIWWVGRQ